MIDKKEIYPKPVCAMTSPAAGPSFSSATAAVYIFNLIVGTGALALPRAFQEAGSVQCSAVQCSAVQCSAVQ